MSKAVYRLEGNRGERMELGKKVKERGKEKSRGIRGGIEKTVGVCVMVSFVK
ncbi:hypothetical protein HmCmsJML001_02206 [Escherichia coli]|nr:hypothetical protein HmCmsJML001_02206 [Escherichia coli]